MPVDVIEVPFWLITLALPIAVLFGGWVYRMVVGVAPIRKHRDELLSESLDLAERKIQQLQEDMRDLEASLRVLRADLAWERQQNRALRDERLSILATTMPAPLPPVVDEDEGQ